jgi:hypothetical protein
VLFLDGCPNWAVHQPRPKSKANAVAHPLISKGKFREPEELLEFAEFELKGEVYLELSEPLELVERGLDVEVVEVTGEV